jgi:hypothetical protein
MMRGRQEVFDMRQKVWDLEAKAPHYLKDNYTRAQEVLSWVLGELDEEDVIAFGE